jgi:hypothetical protein
MRSKNFRMRQMGHIARMGEKANEYETLVGKPKGGRRVEQI